MNSKITLRFLCMTLLLTAVQAKAQFGTGLKVDPSGHSSFKKVNASTRGYGETGSLPSAYSLKMYTPYVKSQGLFPSCAGWAVSYSALSTQYAISYGLTNRNIITAKSFCPYYSYNKVNVGDPNCKNGSGIPSHIVTLIREGSKKFYLPLMGCGVSITDEFAFESKYYKVQDGYYLENVDSTFNWGNPDMKDLLVKFFAAPKLLDLQVVKRNIYNKKPVIFGAYIPGSFNGGFSGDLWEPTAEERNDMVAAVMDNNGGHRSHAMLVVGYDDTKYGGAFEIMNSWSESFGNKGYVWVKYSDFKMLVQDAYTMEMFQVGSDMATKTGVVWGDCLNGFGLVRGANGDAYEGQFKNGQFHGYGIYTWANGQAYAGQWVDGKRHGEATCYYSENVFGQVTYANDAFQSGFNELKFQNGDKYKGYMKNGQYDGYGEYTFANGARILGMFSGGKMNGLCKVYEADGSVFMGYYSDNVRNGKGILVSSDKKISAGEWVYGVYTAKKTFGFADDKTMNLKPGMHSDIYLSADCASGNCLTGEGKRVTGNGNTYTGTFVDGLEDGKGTMYFVANNMTYSGSWKQGSFHGVGEMTLSNGVMLISEFQKGGAEGYVLYYNSAGNMLVKLFKGNELIAEYKENTSNPTSSASSVPGTSPSVLQAVLPLK